MVKAQLCKLRGTSINSLHVAQSYFAINTHQKQEFESQHTRLFAIKTKYQTRTKGDLERKRETGHVASGKFDTRYTGIPRAPSIPGTWNPITFVLRTLLNDVYENVLVVLLVYYWCH